MAKGKRRGRGEGSIEQLPDGKFRAFLSAGKDAAGKRIRLTFTGDTKREALSWLRERQAEASAGKLAVAGKMTVGDWLDRWLDSKRPKVEPGTWRLHARCVRSYLKPTIGRLPIGRLDKLAVEGMHAALTGLGKSPDQQHKAATTLRAALAEAVESGLVPMNAAKLVKKPKVDRAEMVCLDAKQAAAFLLAAQQDRLAALYDLALDTGMRPGELFALHWPDVDFAAGTVFVRRSLEEIEGRLRLKKPKTAKSRRRIPVAPRTMDALLAHRRRMAAAGKDVTDGPVFCSKRGGFLRLSNFHKSSFHPTRVAAGLPHFRPYDLRHTCATLLLSRGVNIKVVSERLGHESIEITLKHYSHVLPGMQEQAAATVQSIFGDWHDNGTQRTQEGANKAAECEEE